MNLRVQENGNLSIVAWRSKTHMFKPTRWRAATLGRRSNT